MTIVNYKFYGVENATGWATATYSGNDVVQKKGKGTIVIERAGKDTAKTNQTVFRIKFKAIENNVSNVNISLSNIMVTNVNNDMKLGSIPPLKVNIGTSNSGNNGNDNPENNTGNDNNSSNNNSGSNNNNSNSGNNSNNTKPGNNNNSNNSKPGNNNNSNSENNTGDNENNENKDNEDNVNDNQNNEDNNINDESNDNDENNIIKREEQDENTKNGNLPSTGNATNIIILVVIGIAVVGIIATILFIKIRKINKNEQM